jgi:hypothetical protein
MRNVAVLSVLVLAGNAFASASPIQIEIRGDRVSIHAEKVPLVQVLNGVAWESKMKIVYDTSPPQDLVTIDLKDVTLRDAVTQLLRGHGLVYVARMDASGARIDTLVLTSGGAGPVRMSAPQPPPMPEAPAPEYYDAGMEVPPEPMIEPQPDIMPPPTPTPPSAAWQPSPVVFPGGMGQPGMGQPGMGQPPMGQPGMQPGMTYPGMGMPTGPTGQPMYPHGGGGMGMGMGRGGHGAPPNYYPPPPPPPEEMPQEIPPEP